MVAWRKIGYGDYPSVTFGDTSPDKGRLGLGPAPYYNIALRNM